MKYPKIPIFFLAAAMSSSTLVVADDDELEFDEAQLYFELNDTDGDLGIHGKVDGDAYKWVEIESPNGRTVMKVTASSGLRRQGLTELFFESAEPTFDELNPRTFFKRFPEGVYEWEGRTLDYEEIEGEVPLSHIIPAAPVVASVGRNRSNPGFEEVYDEEEEEYVVEKQCWPKPYLRNGVVIKWNDVTMSHKDMWDVSPQPLLIGESLRYDDDDEPDRKFPLGSSGDLEDLVYYEFVAEIDGTEFKTTALIPPNVTHWTVPRKFIRLAKSLEVENDEGELEPVEEIKFEIIVRVETGEGEDDDEEEVDSTLGNQSAVEDCFKIVED